jgi:uncharacterized SAM-binding protein YcdF (DUF218 family)
MPTVDEPDLAGDAADLNAIARWLAPLDVDPLSPARLEALTGRPSVDLLVLLGSSVLDSLDLAASAWREGIAPRILVSGGVGHSTGHLRDNVRADQRYSGVPLAGRGEAEILRDLLLSHHHIPAEALLLEFRSTNCGSNAIESRRLLTAIGANPRTLLLVQDPTMQLRSWASFRRAWGDDASVRFLNLPAYLPRVVPGDGGLAFAAPAPWSMERFVSLILGEVPRLRDDEKGYGPRGQGFIEHVDVPPQVEAAHGRLARRYGSARAPER